MGPLLTVKEAAAVLKMNPWTIYRAVNAGELEAVRAGRSIRIPEEALQAFLTPAIPPEPQTRNAITKL